MQNKFSNQRQILASQSLICHLLFDRSFVSGSMLQGQRCSGQDQGSLEFHLGRPLSLPQAPSQLAGAQESHSQCIPHWKGNQLAMHAPQLSVCVYSIDSTVQNSTARNPCSRQKVNMCALKNSVAGYGHIYTYAANHPPLRVIAKRRNNIHMNGDVHQVKDAYERTHRLRPPRAGKQ